MKKSRYTEEQIAYAMKQAETDTPVAKVIRRMGASGKLSFKPEEKNREDVKTASQRRPSEPIHPGL